MKDTEIWSRYTGRSRAFSIFNDQFYRLLDIIEYRRERGTYTVRIRLDLDGVYSLNFEKTRFTLRKFNRIVAYVNESDRHVFSKLFGKYLENKEDDIKTNQVDERELYKPKEE